MPGYHLVHGMVLVPYKVVRIIAGDLKLSDHPVGYYHVLIPQFISIGGRWGDSSVG